MPSDYLTQFKKTIACLWRLTSYWLAEYQLWISALPNLWKFFKNRGPSQSNQVTQTQWSRKAWKLIHGTAQIISTANQGLCSPSQKLRRSKLKQLYLYKAKSWSPPRLKRSKAHLKGPNSTKPEAGSSHRGPLNKRGNLSKLHLEARQTKIGHGEMSFTIPTPDQQFGDGWNPDVHTILKWAERIDTRPSGTKPIGPRRRVPAKKERKKRWSKKPVCRN